MTATYQSGRFWWPCLATLLCSVILLCSAALFSPPMTPGNSSVASLAAYPALAAGRNLQSPGLSPALAGSFAPASAAEGCAAQGWASQNGGTSGGGPATPTVVTTYDQLQAALASPGVKVVQVSGTITIPSGGRLTLQDQSAKTIFGTPGARLASTDQGASTSGIFYVKRCTNLIFRNLIFDGPGAYDTDGNDNLTLDACTNVWVDHCEFRDGLDGNLDVKNASNYVTVSWTKFTYLKTPRAGGPGGSSDHRFSSLIGSSDKAIGDQGALNITFARCWWGPGCVERMPRVRFGQVHIVNSYYNSIVSRKCIGAGLAANLLVQNNVFENVKNPIALLDDNEAAVTETGNLFLNTKGTKEGDGKAAFTPPYSLSVLSAASVRAAVMAPNGAGATLSGNTCAGSGI